MSKEETKNKEPNMGPYHQWESVSTFNRISEQAFSLFDELVEVNWEALDRPLYHLLIRMAYQAKTTSLATRMNISWGLLPPSFPLMRVRLEQVIVCSYLTHEDEEKGFKPFVLYIPIGEYKGIVSALEDDGIAEELSERIDINLSKNEATRAQEEFTSDSEKFERNWTKLDLRSMVKKRDALIKNKELEVKDKLEGFYLSFYKTFSSFVHADGASLSYRYMNLFPTPTGGKVLMVNPTWAVTNSAALALFDIIQCSEILCFLGIATEGKYKILKKSWLQARSEYVKW